VSEQSFLRRVVHGLQWRFEVLFQDAASVGVSVVLRAPWGDLETEDACLRIEDVSSDMARIEETYRQLGRRLPPARFEARKKHGLSFFRVELDSELVGSLWLLHGGHRYLDEVGLSVAVPPDDLWLRDIFIDERRRGQRLFARSLAKAIGTHYPRTRVVWSDTTASNAPSLRAHGSAGFRPVARIRWARLNPLVLIRWPALLSGFDADGFAVGRRLLLQLPGFRRFEREHLA
jgi:hypothetical protein